MGLFSHHRIVLQISALVISLAAANLFAATFTWDSNGATSGTGGTGTWDTTNARFDNGTVIWNNTTNALDTVLFGSTSGTVTLGTTITAGGLRFNFPAYTLTGSTLTLAGTPAIHVQVSNTAIVSSILAGSDGLSKTGPGALTLTGVNTYGGTTAIQAGTLTLGGNAPAGANGALGNSTSAVLLGDTIGSNNASLLTNGAFTIGRDITVQAGNSGTITLGGSHASGTANFTGNIVLNKSVTLTSTALAGVTFKTGTISGVGNVAITGGGIFRFDAVNSYTGLTSVQAGTLILGGDATLSADGTLGNSSSAVIVGDTSGSTGASLFAGGAFTIARDITVQAGSSGVAAIGGTNTSGTANITGNIVLDKNVSLSATSGGTVSFNTGSISGTGGVTKSGSGVVVLSGANSYSGGTIVSLGTLQLSGGDNRIPNGSAITVSGGTLDLTTTNQTAGIVSLTSGSIIGSGSLNGSSFNLQSGSVSTVLAGTGGLTKSTTSALTLTGANSYTGTTSVIAGTLTVGTSAPAGANGAFGNATSAILLGDTTGSNSATLQLNGAFVIGRDITVQAGNTGTPILGGTNASGTATYSGNILLNKSATLSAAAGGVVQFDTGTISGTGGITKTGSGTVVLAGANTYAGGTTISAGTLQLSGGDERLPMGGAVTLSAGILDLTNTNQSVGAVQLISGSIIGSGVLAGSSFAMQSGTVSASLGGTGALSKTTTGTVSLSGPNVYTGGTTVSAGTLQLLGGDNRLATSGSITVAASATLNLNTTNQTAGTVINSGTINGSGVLSASSFEWRSGTVNTTLGGSGSLTKTTSSTVTVNRAHSYTGTTSVLAGILALTADVPAGANGALGNATSAILLGDTSGSSDITMWAIGSYTIGRDITVQAGSTGNVTLGGLVTSSETVNFTGNLTLNRDVTLISDHGVFAPGTVSFNTGSITGTGRVTTTGSGTIVFSEANAYTGGTTVSATLQLVGGDNRLPVGRDILVSNNGNLDLTNTNQTAGTVSTTFGGAITGAGTLTASMYDLQGGFLSASLAGTAGVTISSGGTVTLSGANVYTGATSVLSGILTLGANAPVAAAGALGNSSSAVLVGDTSGSNSATLRVNSGFSIARAIVVQAGSSGTATLGGSNTAGTGRFTGSILLNRSVVLSIPGVNGTVSFDTSISGIGGVTVTGNTVVLTGANTYEGGTTVSGLLRLEGGNNRLPIGRDIAIASGTLDLTSTNQTAGTVLITAGSIIGSGTLTGAAYDLRGGTISAPLGGAAAVVKSTSSSLTLSGASSYTGSTSVLAGTLTISMSALPGVDGPLGNATSAVVVGDTSGPGTASLLIGTGVTMGRDIIVQAGGTNTLTLGGANTTGTVNFTGQILLNKSATLSTTGAGVVAFGAGSISGLGGIVVNGTSGTVVLAGANSYGGATSVLSGTLRVTANVLVASDGPLGNATSNVLLGATFGTSNAALQVNGPFTIGRDITVQAGSSGTATVRGSNTSGTATFTGNILLNKNAIFSAAPGGTVRFETGTISGPGGVTITGGGTVHLAGTNAYLGATSVQNGILVLDGVTAGDITLSSGASFGGHGTISGTVGGTGSVDPGNSPGIITASQTDPTGGLDYNFEFTVANASPNYLSPTNPNNDVFRLTHPTTPFVTSLNTNNAVNVYLEGLSLTLNSGDYFRGGFFTNVDSLSSINGGAFSFYKEDASGPFTYLGKSFVLLNPSQWSVTTQAETADFGGGAVNGYVTQFNYTAVAAVPEPGTLTLTAIATLGLAGYRRWRRRRCGAQATLDANAG